MYILLIEKTFSIILLKHFVFTVFAHFPPMQDDKIFSIIRSLKGTYTLLSQYTHLDRCILKVIQPKK